LDYAEANNPAIPSPNCADEVARAVPVKRSIKAIPNNSPWFLVIVTEMFSLFVKKYVTRKNRKTYIYLSHTYDNRVV
jgi:hypothetical protein